MRKFLILLLIVLTTGCMPEEQEQQQGTRLKVDDVVGNFQVTDIITGKYSFNTETWFGQGSNEAVLFYFFMSGCPDCEVQNPAVINLWNDYVLPSLENTDPDAQRYYLVCIARGDASHSQAQARNYWQELADQQGLALTDLPPLYYDANRAIFNNFAYSGVPRFYAVAPDGIIRWEASTEGTPLSASQLFASLQAAHR